MWPDSCWLLSNRPLYIPDFASSFKAIPMLAVKIGRLGKNVAPRFVSRYICQRTAALVILSSEALTRIQKGEPLNTFEYCFDNAVVLGDWSDSETLFPITLEVMNPTDNATSKLQMPESRAIDTDGIIQAIVRLSRRNTLKMGDVVMVPLAFPEVLLEEGMRISISSDSTDPTALLFTRFK